MTKKVTVTCNVCHKTFAGRWKILGKPFLRNGKAGWAHLDCILSAKYIGLEQ